MKCIVFMLVLLPFVSIHFSCSAQENRESEYLILVADIMHPELLEKSKVYVSRNGNEYKEIKLEKKATRGQFDFNPLINIIKKYNMEGWKIIASNISSGYSDTSGKDLLFIMMGRPATYRILPQPVDTVFDKEKINNGLDFQ